MKLQKIRLQFDGGCRPTNPGNKYGSFQVAMGGREVGLLRRFELGWGTNNEAEFESLLQGLEWCVKMLEEAGLNPKLYQLDIITDSTIVRNRITGQNRKRKSEPERRMFALTEKCWRVLTKFWDYKIRWERRTSNVAAFGH